MVVVQCVQKSWHIISHAMCLQHFCARSVRGSCAHLQEAHWGNRRPWPRHERVSAQRARNSGLKVRVNRKDDTTAADNNKQGDVQAMDFGIPGYEHLVEDVSLVSDRIGSRNFIDLAKTWAPGQDLANPDQWSTPILLALKQAHHFSPHRLWLSWMVY